MVLFLLYFMLFSCLLMFPMNSTENRQALTELCTNTNKDCLNKLKKDVKSDDALSVIVYKTYYIEDELKVLKKYDKSIDK